MEWGGEGGPLRELLVWFEDSKESRGVGEAGFLEDVEGVDGMEGTGDVETVEGDGGVELSGFSALVTDVVELLRSIRPPVFLGGGCCVCICERECEVRRER